MVLKVPPTNLGCHGFMQAGSFWLRTELTSALFFILHNTHTHIIFIVYLCKQWKCQTFIILSLPFWFVSFKYETSFSSLKEKKQQQLQTKIIIKFIADENLLRSNNQPTLVTTEMLLPGRRASLCERPADDDKSS